MDFGSSLTGPVSFGSDSVFAVDSFSWGSMSTGGSSSGAGAGKSTATSSPFEANMTTTVDSPKLLSAEVKGEHFAHIIFCGVNGGCETLEFDMQNAMISSYQISGSGRAPMDAISITFEAITFSTSASSANA